VEVKPGGVSKRVCVSLLPEPQIGEYAIVHTGYAIEKTKSEEATKILAFVKGMAKFAEETEYT